MCILCFSIGYYPLFNDGIPTIKTKYTEYTSIRKRITLQTTTIAFAHT